MKGNKFDVPFDVKYYSLTESGANLYNTTSNQRLHCRSGDLLFIYSKEDNAHMKKLEDFHNARFGRGAIYELKEFKNLVKNNEQLISSGKMGCSHPMTKNEIQQYTIALKKRNKAMEDYRKQQEKINNDPRVVAARINANNRSQQDLNNMANNFYQQSKVWADTQYYNNYSASSFGSMSYVSGNKSTSVMKLGGGNHYRSGGQTYSVRQLGGTNMYRVRQVGNKGHSWNWVY